MKKVSEQNCPCRPSCPLKHALSVIGGKWKIQILCALKADGATRYGSLSKKVDGITNTMLASSLKELEKDGLILRKQYDSMPLKVEYSLSDKAESLMPILGQLAQWGASI